MANKYKVGDIYIIEYSGNKVIIEIIRSPREIPQWDVYYKLLKGKDIHPTKFNIGSTKDRSAKYLGNSKKIIKILYGSNNE